MRFFLLLALLWLSAASAQAQTPAQRLARYRYWEAKPDSLRQVLATQHTDTARLRTLMHLLDVAPASNEAAEAAALSAKLKHPARRAYRLLASATRLDQAKNVAAALDSLQAAVAAFDRLGRPVPVLLGSIRLLYDKLNQAEAQGRYFQAKLAYYRRRGATENMAACHRYVGLYYRSLGDYNQAINHYLQHVALYRTYNRRAAPGQLAVVGAFYNEWGNAEKALYFLRQAAVANGRWGVDNFFPYKTMAQVYLQQQDYPAALRALDQAQLLSKQGAFPPSVKKAHIYTLKSAVLIAQGRTREASLLLPIAQHLADSLHLPLYAPVGSLELDATWARYYGATGDAARAETRWLTAYRKARQEQRTPLRLAYLRELTRFYQQQGRPGPAARYAVSALALADSLDQKEGALHVARYEIEQADRAQTARIAQLRDAQRQEAARARRQRLFLWAVLGGAALLGGVAAALYYAFRRSERLKQLVTHQKQDLQRQRDQLDRSLTDLRSTQTQLIQKEKMASLGELTAGIAHEIQNPLNFVNNFAEVSTELVTELKEAQAAGDGEEVTALADDLAQNLGKIRHHGRRAAAIVKGMLEHARTSTGERAPTDINQLVDEYLRLAYQGLRAKDKSFNATLATDLAPGLPLVDAVGADVGRVLLNLFSNAFYTVHQRRQTGGAGYAPTVGVATARVNGHVEIRVTDNGTGMPAAVKAKIFQPFFTTKPTGEGTGLGLSLSHDIIAQGHGGTLRVESREGEGTTFSVALPLNGATC